MQNNFGLYTKKVKYTLGMLKIKCTRKMHTKKRYEENLWFNVGLNNYNCPVFSKLIALISKDAARLSRWRFFQYSSNSFHKNFFETFLFYRRTFDELDCLDFFSHFIAISRADNIHSFVIFKICLGT